MSLNLSANIWDLSVPLGSRGVALFQTLGSGNFADFFSALTLGYRDAGNILLLGVETWLCIVFYEAKLPPKQ